MALHEHQDFIVDFKGSAGVVDAIILGTANQVLSVPTETFVGWTTETTQAARDIAAVLSDIVEDPASDVAALETFMQQVDAEVTGAKLVDLAEIGRLRVRAGFFNRAISFAKSESGVAMWQIFTLSRASAKNFIAFYEGHPKAV